MAERAQRPSDRAVFVISVAAELAGVHPQTLRIYERKGLVHPKRTSSNSRRYSERGGRRSTCSPRGRPSSTPSWNG